MLILVSLVTIFIFPKRCKGIHFILGEEGIERRGKEIVLASAGSERHLGFGIGSCLHRVHVVPSVVQKPWNKLLLCIATYELTL